MRAIILYLLLIINTLNAQFTDNFSDGNLNSDPLWVGDLNNFVVTDGKLNLMAPASGTSFIHTQTLIPDSFVFTLDALQKFSPSSSNKVDVYLGIDNVNLSITNGIKLQLGENGSTDAIRIFYVRNGVDTLIANGTEGALATDPAISNLRIVKKAGVFQLEADYSGNNNFALQATWSEPINLLGSRYVGLLCSYTSTRVDKFTFDNVSLTPYIPDVIGPLLIEVTPLDDMELLLTFDEDIDISSIKNEDVTIAGVGSPFALSRYNNTANVVLAMFSSPFSGQEQYTVSVSKVKDLIGNITATQSMTFTFVQSAVKGQVLLSEIMYDPEGTGTDYVELYNSSNSAVRLVNMKIGNITKNEFKFLPSITLLPYQYLCLNEDNDNIRSQYNPPDSSLLLEVDLPSFNNGEGNVYIAIEEEIYESFNYNDNLHNGLLNDVETVSLERINFEVSASNVANWASSGASNRYGTPGYANSNSIKIGGSEGEFFSIVSDRFSPNGDGIEEQCIVTYDMPESGFVLSAYVFDQQGMRVSTVANGEILGQKGFVKWDGSLDSDEKARIGVYVIAGEAFNADGKKFSFKFAVKLLDFID